MPGPNSLCYIKIENRLGGGEGEGGTSKRNESSLGGTIMYTLPNDMH